MAAANADRNLLFGILALQMDFVTRDHLVAAMHAWVLAKSKPLGQILREQGALSNERHTLLEALVGEHLKQHGNDPEKSLAAVASPNFVHDELKRIADPDVQASLRRVPGPRPEKAADPYGTVMRSVGTPSSTGSRFRILRPFAKGGLGEVLVAQDEELHREVVVKQIQQQHADDAESRARFLLEAEITGGLEHPGVVPVYGLGQYADGRPYYAMRFVRGDSLKQALERFHKADETPGRDPGERSLELRKLLGRMIDVCQAIAYAHSRSVLHRDLKPGNIMLGKYGETLVVDWGLAKPLDRPEEHLPKSEEGKLTLSSGSSATPTVMGTALGTPQFMSPEQAAGRLDQLGPSADVYSLGATLYCVLTGKAPFTDTDTGEVLQKVQRGDFPKPREVKPNVPPALEAICLKAMALKPQDRYATPQLLADDLEHWLGDEPVSAWPEPWTERAGRWLRRHRTLTAGVASAVLVATIVLGIATVLLTAANERERLAKEEALTQKQKAEANFKMAREAVDRYHTHVSMSDLLNAEGMQPLRRQLLEAAREFYDRFRKERADDPDVKGELGRALFRLAQITADIDSETKAIALHQQALAIFLEQGADYAGDLASCYHHLGRLYRLTKQLTESHEAYRNALAVWEKLLPRDAKYEDDLARTRLGLGNVHEASGRASQARDEYLQAMTIWSRLERDNPKADHQRDLAVTYGNLGMVLAALPGKRKEAQEAFVNAARVLEKLVKAHPNISKYADDLARTQHSLGKVLFRAGEHEEAARAFLAAASTWEQLTRDHPTVLIFHVRLAEAQLDLVDVYRGDKQFAKAAALCEEVVAGRRALAEKQKQAPSYRGDLAAAVSRLGDVHRSAGQFAAAEKAYLEAAGIQENLVKDLAHVPEYRSDLAHTNNNLGLLRLQHNEPARAEDAFTRALALWEGLHRDHPEKSDYVAGLETTCANLRKVTRGGTFLAAVDVFTPVLQTLHSGTPSPQSAAVRAALREAYALRAEVQTLRGDYAKALKDWEQALAVADRPYATWVRLARARTVARTDAYGDAVALADMLAEAPKIEGEALYQLACIYALAVETATKDTRLEAAKARQLADRYADKAVELLSKARAQQYFQSAAIVQKLVSHADWQYVRAREPFQKLVRELQANAATH